MIGKSRKPKNIKFHNQRLVLSLMRQNAVISASEIAQRINLSITTVVKILVVLQENGLIKSMGKGSSTDEGGKKPELFAINESYKHVIAIYAGPDFIQAAVTDLNCRVISHHNYPYKVPESLEQSMQDIADCARAAMEENGLQPDDICAIPVGFDGIVDTESGIIYYPIHNSGWGRNIPAQEMLERRIDRSTKALKGDKSLQAEVDFFHRVLQTLEAGKPARSVECTPEEAAMLATVSLLTATPVIYAANLSEADFAGGSPERNPHFAKVEALAAAEGAEVLPICAQMEADIAELEEEEKKLFLAELGLEQSGLDRLIQKSYHLLGLISYLTAGPTEVRAWTIARGTRAPQAAGKIHTDFERGFIRAEVVAYDDLIACGSMTAAKEKGLVRSEGKEYVMADGDVVLFRFNV